MGQAEALLHAPGEALDVGVPLVGELDELEEVADDRFRVAAGRP
jgi:hypothetical protein